MADLLGVRIPLEGDQRPQVKQVKAMVHGRWINISEVLFTFNGRRYRSYYSDWREAIARANQVADIVAEMAINERLMNALVFVDGAM